MNGGRMAKDKHSGVATVKKRLEDYRELDKYIQQQIERMENLEAKMYYLKAQVLSDMPKSPNAVSDRTGALVAQHDEMEEKIRGLIAERDQEWAWVKRLLAGIRKANERTVIECRYHDGEKWEKIAQILFGDREDFEDKSESYKRACFRIHGEALMEMARLQRQK